MVCKSTRFWQAALQSKDRKKIMEHNDKILESIKTSEAIQIEIVVKDNEHWKNDWKSLMDKTHRISKDLITTESDEIRHKHLDLSVRPDERHFSLVSRQQLPICLTPCWRSGRKHTRPAESLGG